MMQFNPQTPKSPAAIGQFHNNLLPFFIKLTKGNPLTTGATSHSPRSAFTALVVTADLTIKPVERSLAFSQLWETVYQKEVRARIAWLCNYIPVDKFRSIEYARRLLQERCSVSGHGNLFNVSVYEEIGLNSEFIETTITKLMNADGFLSYSEILTHMETGRVYYQATDKLMSAARNLSPPPDMRKTDYNKWQADVIKVCKVASRYYRMVLRPIPETEIECEWVESIMEDAWGDKALADAICEHLENFVRVCTHDVHGKPETPMLIGGYGL